MKRRHFLKLSAIAGAASVLPLWSRLTLAMELPALPIPTLLKPDTKGNISLTLQSGFMNWKPGIKTITWGINSPILGPALQLSRGKKVNIQVTNKLDEATTLHWHGLEVPGDADGGPQAVIEAGQMWNTGFTLDQPAATCWFHPHTHGESGRHVAMGLGGLILVEDEESERLPVPKRWGVDDVPVILQDKRFNEQGQIDYQLDVLSAAVGWFGEMMLTNGAVYPQHSAPKGWVRLRFLNGCNARSLQLATSDNRPMYVIASDGGFLSEPVKIEKLPMLMGERFEVLIDLSDGEAVDIVTLPVKQIGMNITPFDKAVPVLRLQPTLEKGAGTLPDKLVAISALPELEGLPTRLLKLSMDPELDMQGMMQLSERYGVDISEMADHGHDMSAMKLSEPVGSMQQMDHSAHGGHRSDMAMKQTPLFQNANKINGVAFEMDKPVFDVKQGQYERWTISGEGDMMLHPFHIHGAQFRILSENGQPPAKHRNGWKDTVSVDGGVSEVLIRFAHLAPKAHAYMAHCHLLEHEDTGMMLSFTVSA